MHNDTDRAIDEVLEGKPRSGEIAQMIAALEVRRETFERELASSTTDLEQKGWNQRIQEVDKQIRLLSEEMAITDFVERSVRAAATRPRIDMDDDEF